MKSIPPLLLILPALSPLAAQQAGIGQSIELQRLATGQTHLKWFGNTGRTYFVQVSDSNKPLAKWSWAPFIEGGHDIETSYQVDGNASSGFFRLVYTSSPPPPGVSLEAWDADGDQLTNWQEITAHGSNPLKSDTDNDGLPDNWEVAHHLSVLDDGTEDPDSGPNAPFNSQTPGLQSSPLTGEAPLSSSLVAAAESPVTNFQAFAAGVQATPGANLSDKDGDLIPDVEDADPLSIAINWRKSAKPVYVAIPIPEYNSAIHGIPYWLNNHNDIVTNLAVYRNGQWVLINGCFRQFGQGAALPYKFLVNGHLHNCHLGECSNTFTMSDQGTLIGNAIIRMDPVTELNTATGKYVTYSSGFTPGYNMIWRNPSEPPEILGIAPGTTIRGGFASEYGMIHRDGTMMARRRGIEDQNFDNFHKGRSHLERWPLGNSGAVQSSPVYISLQASYPAAGGALAFSTGLSPVLSWIWPANSAAPHPLYTDTTAATGAVPLNFQATPATIGTAPGGEPCLNLSGQVLVGHSGRFYQVPALQGATKISPHGAAILPGSTGSPDIWHGGSHYPLSACVSNLQDIGSSLRVADINDDGTILAIVDTTTAGKKVAILLPVEVKDLKAEGDTDDQVLQGTEPLPTMSNGETERDFWTRRNTYFQTQVPDSGIAWIDPHRGTGNTPDMPRLVASIPNAPENPQVRWRLEVDYMRGNGYRASYVEEFSRQEDKVMIPASTDGSPVFTNEMDAGQDWRMFESADWQNEIDQRGFFGGTAKLFLWIPGTSSTAPTEPVITFRIGGRNPDPTLARAFLNATGGASFPYLYALARHETFGRVRVNGAIRFYNQFYSDYQGGPIGDASRDMGWAGWAKGWPVYNLDRGSNGSGRYQNGPGGYGMFQLTLGPKHPVATVPAGNEPFITRRQIWNWQDNTLGALAELQGKRNAAQSLRDGLATAYPQWPELPNEGGLSGLDAIVVSYYNGTGGLPSRDINKIDRKTPWTPQKSGQTQTWKFHQNQQDYVQSVNLQINNTTP